MGPSTDEVEAQLREEIRQTRGEMSGTIDALQEKLAPERIKEQVKEAVQEHATEAYVSAKDALRGKAEDAIRNVSQTVACAVQSARTALERSPVTRTVRKNPMPFALAGAGLGLFALARRSAPLAMGVAALAVEVIVELRRGRRRSRYAGGRSPEVAYIVEVETLY